MPEILLTLGCDNPYRRRSDPIDEKGFEFVSRELVRQSKILFGTQLCGLSVRTPEFKQTLKTRIDKKQKFSCV